MPHLKINADAARAVPADGQDLTDTLRSALAACPDGVRIVIMVHGFKYSHRSRRRDPHRLILAPDQPAKGRRATSWPRRLSGARHREVLTIGFGWQATGTIWAAMRQTSRAATALADLLGTLQGLTDRPLGILAHSLGARVVLLALRALPGTGPTLRAVFLAGAAFRSDAVPVPQGRAEIINIVSRENRLFDAMFKAALRPFAPCSKTIGCGGMGRHGWLDLKIDDPAVRRHLQNLGHRLPAPRRRICHRFGYRRPGIFRLHRALLTAKHRLTLAELCPATSPRSAFPEKQTLSPALPTPSFDARQHQGETACPSSFTIGQRQMDIRYLSRWKKWACRMSLPSLILAKVTSSRRIS